MKNLKFSFSQLSMYTGYVVALFATSMFLWNKDQQDLNMVPLAKLFVDTAQVSAEIENNKKQKKS